MVGGSSPSEPTSSMKTELHRFKQETWDKDQLDVTIHEGAIVAVDGVEVHTSREQALANIILRLNAGMLWLKADIEKLKNP